MEVLVGLRVVNGPSQWASGLGSPKKQKISLGGQKCHLFGPSKLDQPVVDFAADPVWSYGIVGGLARFCAIIFGGFPGNYKVVRHWEPSNHMET